MTVAAWRDAQNRVRVEPSAFVGAALAQSKLMLDDVASGGAFSIDPTGRGLLVTDLESVAYSFAAAGTFGQPKADAVEVNVRIFTATGTQLAPDMNLARFFVYAATGTVVKPKFLLDVKRSFAALGTHLVGKYYALFKNFPALGEFRPAKLLNSLLEFSAIGTMVPDGVLTRTSILLEQAEAFWTAILRGRRGTIPLEFRIVKSNVLGEDLGTVPGVLSTTGSVSMSNFRDHAWELSFEMIQNDFINPVRDYVKVYADVHHGSGAVESYPLGLYRLAKPSGTLQKSHRTWACQGFSLEDLLARHESDVPYSVAKNVDILGRVQSLIMTHAGVPDDRILFPATTAPARRPIQFDPASGASGNSWLAICNDLLESAGYYALMTDAEGNFVTEKMGSKTVMQPDMSYEENSENMITGSIADDWDDERFANKVVVKSQDVADSPPLISKAYNRNPDSEGSINFLGRTIQKTITLQTATSKADMDVMAQAELEKASGYYRKLGLASLFDPRAFAPRRVYGLYLTDVDGNVVVDGRWNQINVGVALTNPSTGMTHEVSRIEEI